MQTHSELLYVGFLGKDLAIIRRDPSVCPRSTSSFNLSRSFFGDLVVLDIV